jgi:hypothetical protein
LDGSVGMAALSPTAGGRSKGFWRPDAGGGHAVRSGERTIETGQGTNHGPLQFQRYGFPKTRQCGAIARGNGLRSSRRGRHCRSRSAERCSPSSTEPAVCETGGQRRFQHRWLLNANCSRQLTAAGRQRPRKWAHGSQGRCPDRNCVFLRRDQRPTTRRSGSFPAGQVADHPASCVTKLRETSWPGPTKT